MSEQATGVVGATSGRGEGRMTISGMTDKREMRACEADRHSTTDVARPKE